MDEAIKKGVTMRRLINFAGIASAIWIFGFYVPLKVGFWIHTVIPQNCHSYSKDSKPRSSFRLDRKDRKLKETEEGVGIGYFRSLQEKIMRFFQTN